MALYVDGALVGTNAHDDLARATAATGGVGYDNLAGWGADDAEPVLLHRDARRGRRLPGGAERGHGAATRPPTTPRPTGAAAGSRSARSAGGGGGGRAASATSSASTGSPPRRAAACPTSARRCAVGVLGAGRLVDALAQEAVDRRRAAIARVGRAGRCRAGRRRSRSGPPSRGRRPSACARSSPARADLGRDDLADEARDATAARRSPGSGRRARGRAMRTMWPSRIERTASAIGSFMSSPSTSTV